MVRSSGSKMFSHQKALKEVSTFISWPSLKLLVIFLTVIWSNKVVSGCPSSCFCDENDEYVSCVGDGIWKLPPDIPRTAVRLELRNYIITALGPADFEGLVDLHELKLQQTQIQDIENGTFSSMWKLQRLELSQNFLRNLTIGIFEGVSELRYLDLSSNQLNDVENSFSDLGNVEQINLRANLLTKLTGRTFLGLHKVQYLNLDSNQIIGIEVDAFQYLTNLAHLILSNNPLLQLSRLDFFGSRLQYIDVSHVGLQRVPQSLTQYVRDLRLAKNNLTSIAAGDFESYPYLGLLVLDDNFISDVENDALGRQEYLMRLWLNGNKLTYIPANLPISLRSLYMEENQIEKLKTFSFKGLMNLEHLFLQRNKIVTLEPCAFCDLVALKTLDLQANRIENLTEGIFSNLTRLDSLDLSQNPLKILQGNCFAGLEKLKTLQLSRINTKQMSVEGSFFDSLKSLLVLEIYDSPSLAVILVNSTRALHALRNLQEINLMHNKLVQIRSDFPSFFLHIKVVKLSGNNWNCTSSIQWLTKWIKGSNIQFYRSYSISCATPVGLQSKPVMMLVEADFHDGSTTTNSSSTIQMISTTNTPKITELSNIKQNLTTEPPLKSSTKIVTTTLEAVKTTEITSSSTLATTTIELSTPSPILNTTELAEIKEKETKRPTETPTTEVITVETTKPVKTTQKSSIKTTVSPVHTITHLNSTINNTIDLKHFTLLKDPLSSTSTKSPQRMHRRTSPTTLEFRDVPEHIGDHQVPTRSSQIALDSHLKSHLNDINRAKTLTISASLSIAFFLLFAGILLTFLTFHYRQGCSAPPGVKECQMRRSSSISYSPQRDEVAIISVSEGSVGLRTDTHHGLGNKLYYVMAHSDANNFDLIRETLPDPPEGYSIEYQKGAG